MQQTPLRGGACLCEVDHEHHQELELRSASPASPSRAAETTAAAFPIRLNDRWRVTVDPLQWRLEHLSRSRWDGSAYCVTRDALLRNIRERCGPVSADALGLIESLPPFHPDRGMSP